jgi:hypothetical protein
VRPEAAAAGDPLIPGRAPGSSGPHKYTWQGTLTSAYLGPRRALLFQHTWYIRIPGRACGMALVSNGPHAVLIPGRALILQHTWYIRVPDISAYLVWHSQVMKYTYKLHTAGPHPHTW